MKSGRQRHYNGCHFVINNWFFIDNFPAIIAKLCLKNPSIFQNDTDKRSYFVCKYKMFSLNDEGAFYRRLLAKICWTKLLLFSPDKSFPFDSNLIFFHKKIETEIVNFFGRSWFVFIIISPTNWGPCQKFQTLFVLSNQHY